MSKFEQAVDTVISGDETALQALLREEPDLVRARSTRNHHGTLLHYVSANGVEDDRQKTPQNAVRIAEILLNAGADVNATAEMYGGGAMTLGLTATSVHPARAGVQIALLETLLEHGAIVEAKPGEAVNACLANGRPEAAEFLSTRGAHLDLEGAAGLGRLDVVRSYFNSDGSLAANATKEHMASGFMWACEYGRTDVVKFLLDNAFDISTQVNGMTGLHWAAVGGQLDTIYLLLKHGAPLEVKNHHGATVLGQAAWVAVNSDPVCHWPNDPIDWNAILKALIDAGANVDAHPGLRERVEGLLERTQSNED